MTDSTERFESLRVRYARSFASKRAALAEAWHAFADSADDVARARAAGACAPTRRIGADLWLRSARCVRQRCRPRDRRLERSGAECARKRRRTRAAVIGARASAHREPRAACGGSCGRFGKLIRTARPASENAGLYFRGTRRRRSRITAFSFRCRLQHASRSSARRPTSAPATAARRWVRKRLRVAGIADALRARGIDVIDRGNLAGPVNPWLPPHDGYRHLPEVVTWTRNVMHAVKSELAADRLPVLLGGDHCLAIGSITAVAQPLPRARQETAHPLARRTRRFQHEHDHAVRQHPRHAGGVPLPVTARAS